MYADFICSSMFTGIILPLSGPFSGNCSSFVSIIFEYLQIYFLKGAFPYKRFTKHAFFFTIFLVNFGKEKPFGFPQFPSIFFFPLLFKKNKGRTGPYINRNSQLCGRC